MQLRFISGEEEYLNEMRTLSTDADGNQVFVGLSLQESIEWHQMHQPDRRCSHDRYFELYQKHESARFAVLAAERELRVINPSRN